MAERSDTSTAELIATARSGSVIAAAGCGKTEQIAVATKLGIGRRLILTHTHAGVDALRQRLKDHKVPSNLYYVATISGWCLRYVTSFPKRAELKLYEPKNNEDWLAIYLAAAKLIQSGAVDRVLAASYTGVYVDEYQDCGNEQHSVMVSIAKRLPTCIFGDHLQAIFDFKGQKPVDWKSDVFPIFPEVICLTKPWRWHKVGNTLLANWIEGIRVALDNGQQLDFRNLPSCVKYEWLPDQKGPRQAKIISTCKAAMNLDGQLIVIADPTNLEGRANIAKVLAKQGFSNIEPIDCKSLFKAAKALEDSSAASRLSAALDFLEKCISGLGRSKFEKAVQSRKAGGKLGTAEFGDLIDLGIVFEREGGGRYLLELFDQFERRLDSHVFRREMFSAMRSGVKLHLAGQSTSIVDALWHVQNRVRHLGRFITRRSVGSTLLVKGLEFEHSVIIHSASMNRKDWYVALTRATKSLTVLSPQKQFQPSA